MDSKKSLKEFENSFLKINSRFKLHKFEFSILKWHFKTKIWKIWNFHFQNRISDFILKNFPMFIPEIPIFNLKIGVWHFLTIFGQNRQQFDGKENRGRNLKKITGKNQKVAFSTLRIFRVIRVSIFSLATRIGLETWRKSPGKIKKSRFRRWGSSEAAW